MNLGKKIFKIVLKNKIQYVKLIICNDWTGFLPGSKVILTFEQQSILFTTINKIKEKKTYDYIICAE